MEKPFTIKVNDLQENIVKLMNEASLPCYVLKTMLLETIRLIEDADGKEISNYFNEMNKEKEGDK